MLLNTPIIQLHSTEFTDVWAWSSAGPAAKSTLENQQYANIDIAQLLDKGRSHDLQSKICLKTSDLLSKNIYTYTYNKSLIKTDLPSIIQSGQTVAS